MPAKFRNKTFLPGATYHIYNKGLEGKEVFREAADYEYFISQLKRYLSVDQTENKPGYKTERPYLIRHRQEMNLQGEVELLAYCLMPDKYRLLVKQNSENGITKLMRRVITNYSMWFNQKYHRRGVLFENVYRAVIVEKPEDAVKLSCLIHWAPAARVVKRYGIVETITTITPEEYMYSSFQNYINKRQEEWINTDFITTEFKRSFASKWVSLNQMVNVGRTEWEKDLEDLIIEK